MWMNRRQAACLYMAKCYLADSVLPSIVSPQVSTVSIVVSMLEMDAKHNGRTR